MHRIYLFAVTILLGIASLSVAVLAMSVQRPNALANDSTNQEQIVRRFYDAVNVQINTGDSSDLVELLHPDFTDENPFPAVSSGSDGLVEYVDTLHADSPESRIEIETVVADDDQVIAVVSVNWNSESHALGAWFENPAAIWSPMERFRISGNQIIERISPTHDLVMLEKLFDLPITLKADLAQSLRATLLTFEEFGSARFGTAAGPAVLHVISGELALRVSTTGTPAQLQPGTARDSMLSEARALLPGEVSVMEHGSSLTIPADVGFSAISSEGPSSALYISTVAVSPLGQGIQKVSHSSAGVNVRDLGWFPHDSLSEGPQRIITSQITLMPDASLTASTSPLNHPSLLWMEEGTVFTELDSAIRGSSAAGEVNRQFLSGVYFGPDDGLAYQVSPGATLHNMTDAPAVMWVIDVELQHQRSEVAA